MRSVLVAIVAAWPSVAAGQHAPDDAAIGRYAHLQAAIDAIDGRALDGRRVRLADLRDRVVLIEFWATWCAPCLEEIPTLRHAYERFGPRGFEIVGVNLDVSDRRSVVSWLNRHRLPWAQLYDGRGYRSPLARRLGVRGLPTSFLLDARGRVVAMNLRGDALLEAIAVLVDGHEETARHPAMSRSAAGKSPGAPIVTVTRGRRSTGNVAYPKP